MEKEETIRFIKYLEQYDASFIGKSDEKPIVVVGPTGGKWNLRVYCYGGRICTLSAEPLPQNEKEEYANITKDNNAIISKEYPQYYKEGEEAFNSLRARGIRAILGDFGTEKKPLLNKYLDYSMAATEARFINGEADGERKVQTNLVKEYMHKGRDSKWIIIDMEYKINSHNKPDIIVFDGAGFGIVELKYAGKSMGPNDANSLKKHYDKFYKSIYHDRSDLIVR